MLKIERQAVKSASSVVFSFLGNDSQECVYNYIFFVQRIDVSGV